MRRREKFVLSAIILSLGLLALQYVSLEYRYYAVAVLAFVSYFVSAWALSEDLQRIELLMLVPVPALFATAVSLFYFLLPSDMFSRIILLSVFGIGVYANLLTANIYSVGKGRTIQLLHAAHAIGLFLTLITSLLLSNTIFSLNLPFYAVGGLVALSHFPLILSGLWVVQLTPRIEKTVVYSSLLLVFLLFQFATVLTFLPYSIWYTSLFLMSILYLGISILRSSLVERLFSRALVEYALVFIFVAVLFIFNFPLK
ncbi:MAG: hypothetical protein GW946_03685 [Candidatus Pacebacteria bacterium]|nr:hypothetical protein [Candidatus Paceibacterota bacterium]PIR60055.1 MAG: hypothetical protein COU67_03900 [Candidatus Pacebacteria bacterium CG10_big_fil_rev_8_21_14_0_10_44_54]